MFSEHRTPVDTGIEVLGRQRRGTRICQLFSSVDDLVDVTVPFIYNGLLNNEYCVVVSAEPLEEDEMADVLEEEVEGYESFISGGQLEIISHRDYYCCNSSYDFDITSNSSMNKLNHAIEHSFDGMRIAGNLSWLEESDSSKAMYCEAKIATLVPDFPILGLGSYALSKCTTMELLDLVAVYDYVIVKLKEDWDILDNGKRKRETEELRRLNEKLLDFAEDLSLAIKQPLANIMLGIDMLDNILEHQNIDDLRPEMCQIARTIRNYAGSAFSQAEELLDSVTETEFSSET
ncbi:MAG: MEDS domain-containing protein [Actinobacteria bacterium]|nr:MEDS domain-containing protein [Actinomycetota bacterium]